MKLSRKTIIASVVVILVAGGVAFALLRNSEKNSNPAEPQNPESRVTEEQATQPENPNASPQPSSYTGTSQISVSLSSPTNGQEFNNTTVVVRAILSGASSGTCTATFTKSGSNEVVVTAPVVQAPTYYTCSGFNVDRSQFTATGEWTLRLNVKADGAEGNSEPVRVVVQ